MGTIIHYCMPLTQKVMDILSRGEERDIEKEADL
jgi:hypothetical protein